MNKVQKYKNYMIERYLYLFENSEFIYNYFMREETIEEKKEHNRLKKKVSLLSDYYKINFKLLNPYTLYMLESIIFEDKPLEETIGCSYIEGLKYNKDSKERIKKGKKLKENYDKEHGIKMYAFDVIDILFELYENISRQTNEYKNRLDKLTILDEYIRIAKYTNDSRTWSGGYHLDTVDLIFPGVDFRLKKHWVDLTPNREHFDVGIKNNELIDISKNISFSNEDKKRIYFMCHPDEMDYHIRIRCNQNGIYEIDRPLYSKPCNGDFRLKEKDLFCIDDEKTYTFLTLCPYCLYIVGVNSNLITNKIQEEIVLENKRDPNIYEKKYTESKLKALQNRKNN